MASKEKLKEVARFEQEGFVIRVLDIPAKTQRGKHRFWFLINPREANSWRVCKTIGFARSAQVFFEADTPSTQN